MSGAPRPTTPHRRRGFGNIVLFVADDLGKDLGCYGNTSIRTPAIDKFAADATCSPRLRDHGRCLPGRSVITRVHIIMPTPITDTKHSYHHSRPIQIRLPVMLSRGGYRTALAASITWRKQSSSSRRSCRQFA